MGLPTNAQRLASREYGEKKAKAHTKATELAEAAVQRLDVDPGDPDGIGAFAFGEAYEAEMRRQDCWE